MDVTPTRAGLDIWVGWDPASSQGQADAYRVLRGATPDTLEAVEEVSASHRSYFDHRAVLTGKAFWYQVEALDAQGTVIETSQPALVDPR